MNKFKKLMEKKLLEIKNKKIELNFKIEKENKTTENLKKELKEVSEEKSKYNDLLEKLIKVFRERGIIVYCKNKKIGVKEWDKVFLKENLGEVVALTKSGSELYKFQGEQSRALKFIMKNYKYNSIITMVDEDRIRFHIRIE